MSAIPLAFPRPAGSHGPQLMIEQREMALRARVLEQEGTIACLTARIAQYQRVTAQQADHIDLLQQLLTPPGPRAVSRVRRSAWPVRTTWRLRWAAARIGRRLSVWASHQVARLLAGAR